jgi:NADP-dependent 3-hydroxy acid dehydrogenase YdfG
MPNQTQTTIATGSSSGIGLDIAKGFVRQGNNVVLNGRDPDKLAAVAAELGAADHRCRD